MGSTTRLPALRLLTLLMIGGAAAAAHAQATIGDCETIQAADAYNQCLAKFGPASKGGNLAPERPGDVKGSSEEAAASAGRPKGAHVAGVGRRGRYGRAVRHGAGRKRITFTVRRRHR